MDISIADIRVELDQAAVRALNDREGLVGEGTLRAGEATAERIRRKIQQYGLIDTGNMLRDVQATLTEATADRVVVSAGTPNVEYTLYQRDHFLLEALSEATPADWNQ